MSSIRILAAASLAALAACAAPAADPAVKDDAGPGEFVLHTRSRKDGAVAPGTLHWDAKKTAVVICDMWDTHDCKSAARRVGEMVPKLNELLRSARAKGALVIHCPSDVTGFYKDTPQRRLAQEAPPAAGAPEIKRRPYDKSCEGPWPFDNEKWGCDDDPPCPVVTPGPWRRQHPGIEILPGDALSDQGTEVNNLCVARGITNIILTGVHTNYCIVNRSFGIRQTMMLKRNIVLVRDLTDSLYNPKNAPFVSHERGTELVVEHIEKYWCPTVLSSDLIRR